MEKQWYMEAISIIVGFIYIFWMVLVADLIICKIWGGATPWMFRIFRHNNGKKGGGA